MDINRTYEALTSPTPPQHLLRAGSSFATSTALSLLIKIENTPLLALSYSQKDLQARFPHDRVPLCARGVFKQELSRYRAWRRMLFDLFLLATGFLPDGETVAGLERIARLEFKRLTPDLYILRHTIPENMQISELTFAKALQIDRELSGHQRQAFRSALSMLDRLQEAPLAAGARHLLPEGIIGRLPAPSGHLYHAPLPIRLNEVYSAAPPLLRAAMPFVYRLCIVTKILTPDQDPTLDELAQECLKLWNVEPSDHGFHRPSQIALKTYIRNIGNHATGQFEAPKLSHPAHVEAWSDLRDTMREREKAALLIGICAVSRHAIPQSMSPAHITADWIQKTMDTLSGGHRNAFRSGIFILDKLILDDDFPNDLLPTEVSGLARERRKARS